MKTIKNKYLFVAFAIITLTGLGSCSSDYLDVTPVGTDLESEYYQTQEEAYSGVVAVYDVMRQSTSSFNNTVSLLNAASDDHYAGGGSSTDGAGIQAVSNYTSTSVTMPDDFFSKYYQGIYRANYLLTKLPDIDMDESYTERYTAECKALRAWYYFNLVRLFGNIPLITTPLTTSEYYNVTQATSDEVYAQIEQDLLDAIDVLPTTVSASTEAGRFSQGTARAILGEVYLTEGKNALAAAQFELVNGTPGGTSQYGYSLLADYADLWDFDNKYNSESILETAHSSSSDASWDTWGTGTDEGNTLNVMVGPRGYTLSSSSTTAPDLPSGWSFNPITQDLYDAIKDDPRFSSTVLDLTALVAAGEITYLAGYQDTGYLLYKFIPTQDDVTTGGGDSVLNYDQNFYNIRLADTYLLECEALNYTGTRAQALLDAVRARVGLASVTVSETAVANERRLELAGEGHRFFDLVRTGKAATTLASRGFVSGVNEIFPIPYAELENTKLVQNPGYN
jgi:hypothetical protein